MLRKNMLRKIFTLTLLTVLLFGDADDRARGGQGVRRGRPHHSAVPRAGRRPSGVPSPYSRHPAPERGGAQAAGKLQGRADSAGGSGAALRRGAERQSMIYELDGVRPELPETVNIGSRQAPRSSARCGSKAIAASGSAPCCAATMNGSSSASARKFRTMRQPSPRRLARIVEESPESLHEAPHSTPISRPDEVAAARKPVLQWRAK